MLKLNILHYKFSKYDNEGGCKFINKKNCFNFIMNLK